MGLAGMAFALLGADVVLTDTTEPVLALLRRNVEQNMTPAALRLNDAAWAVDVAGSVTVEELDWSQPEHYSKPALAPPFDFVLAADCVYSETAVPHFLNAVLAMCGRRTSVVVCNEFRSKMVHDVFITEFSKWFAMRKVPLNRMDPAYQHPLIQIYLMKRKRETGGGGGENVEGEEAPLRGEEDTKASNVTSEGACPQVLTTDGDRESSHAAGGGAIAGVKDVALRIGRSEGRAGEGDRRAEDEETRFQTRRQGSELARVLGAMSMEGAGEKDTAKDTLINST